MAAYEYDPFGNVQTVAGSYGASNPFRSATKYTDDETGLLYYGQRYYSPQLGRFINRDPIEEQGGLNLYGFCGNDGINCFDYLGMDPPSDDPPVVLDPIEFTADRDRSQEAIDQYNLNNTLSDLNASRDQTPGYWSQVGSNMSNFSYGVLKGIFYDLPVGAWNLGKTAVQLQNPLTQAQVAAFAARFANDPIFRAAVVKLFREKYQIVIDDLSTQAGFMQALGRVGGQIIGTKGLDEIVGALNSVAAAEDALAAETLGPPSLMTNSGEAYFWSGLGRGGATTAAGAARTGGGTTLEMLLESRGIQMPAWDAANPASVAAWQDVSAQFARGASGEVRAVLGDSLRPGNIWQTVEMPALQANPNVTTIIRVNPSSGAETVIWTRP